MDAGRFVSHAGRLTGGSVPVPGGRPAAHRSRTRIGRNRGSEPTDRRAGHLDQLGSSSVGNRAVAWNSSPVEPRPHPADVTHPIRSGHGRGVIVPPRHRRWIEMLAVRIPRSCEARWGLVPHATPYARMKSSETADDLPRIGNARGATRSEGGQSRPCEMAACSSIRRSQERQHHSSERRTGSDAHRVNANSRPQRRRDGWTVPQGRTGSDCRRRRFGKAALEGAVFRMTSDGESRRRHRLPWRRDRTNRDARGDARRLEPTSHSAIATFPGVAADPGTWTREPSDIRCSLLSSADMAHALGSPMERSHPVPDRTVHPSREVRSRSALSRANGPFGAGRRRLSGPHRSAVSP